MRKDRNLGIKTKDFIRVYTAIGGCGKVGLDLRALHTQKNSRIGSSYSFCDNIIVRNVARCVRNQVCKLRKETSRGKKAGSV